MSPRRSEALQRIESLVCRDVGRGTRKLMEATKGDLAAAAETLAGARSVGLITGFFVPRGDVAAPETDGPVGTALLAASLAACGMKARIAVDGPCAEAVRAAVAAAGEVAVDEVTDVAATTAAWKRDGVD
ncbi:MAG TPA: glutamate cyclase domain-containing protein, partial [Reyranellaceae bacterium]|nr:glutamate cyclase domain-containing protein [Reyranellaceae bacterium]